MNPRTTDRHRWFERDLVDWCRPFTGASKKPLHRLRGLYADHLAELTEDAVTARLAGIREASKAEKRVDGKPTAEKVPAAKATKKVAKQKPKAKQARRAPGKKARRP